MKISNRISGLKEGDSVQTEWSQISYDLWCREKAQEFIAVPEKRIVDLYEIVRSVIEKDFTPAEQRAAQLHWYCGLSIADAAKQEGVSRATMYKAINKGKDKIRLVLKHLINTDEYKIPVDIF